MSSSNFLFQLWANPFYQQGKINRGVTTCRLGNELALIGSWPPLIDETTASWIKIIPLCQSKLLVYLHLSRLPSTPPEAENIHEDTSASGEPDFRNTLEQPALILICPHTKAIPMADKIKFLCESDFVVIRFHDRE